MLEGAKNPLYDGCREGHSQLSLAARVLQTKADYNMSEKCADSVCQMLNDYLPDGNMATDSHYETEKLMRNLGLPYFTIDVCINKCMIFWKEDERWKHVSFVVQKDGSLGTNAVETKYHIAVCGISL